MKTGEKRKITLMIDSDVYQGLREKVGGRGMGDYISQLARPHVVVSSLEESYLALSRDIKNNRQVNEWNSLDEAIGAENIWRL
jgi:hypothetical protein